MCPICMSWAPTLASLNSPHTQALLADRDLVDGDDTMYVCENHVCQQPVVGLEQIDRAWHELAPQTK